MAATRRARRLAALALALLLALVVVADGARNSSATASPSATTAARASSTRTSARAASDSSDSESDRSDPGSNDGRSASGDDSSEAGVAPGSAESTSDSDSASDSTSGSASLSDGPGEVHAASFSDSASDASDAASDSASTATGDSTAWPTTAASADDWTMTSVTVIHARVQSDEPEWDEERQTFVSMYGDTFAEKFRAALDTANTASVEGALMYVQAEGINVQEQSTECERKNGMAYVVFYALQIMQTRNSVALYQSSAPAMEYCPYVAMDSGRCTPTSGDSVFPDECYQFDGLQGEPDIGPCVGGESKDTDFRAPYPDTYWFSLPNSCPLEERADKTDACREEYPGGLCDYGVAPDGENCTFAYRILGYISIDDLVGITRLKDKATGEYFANYSQFCEAGGVEFSAVVDEEDETVEVDECLSFWDDPTNATANAQRAQTMVDMYAELVDADTDGRMVALPSVDALTASNPPCYLNNVQCADATHGCRRVGYFQVCQLCSSDDDDDECAVAPEGYSFPDLQVVEDSSSASGSDSGSSSGPASSSTTDVKGESDRESDATDSSASESDEDEDAIKSTSSGAVSTTSRTVSTLVWLAAASASLAMVTAAI